MVNVTEKIYLDLMKRLREQLVYPILGKDYYNMGLDVYTVNENTIRDLKYEFDKLELSRNLYKKLTILLSIVLLIYFISNLF